MRPLSLVSRASGDRVAPADTLEPIAIVGLATRFSQDAATTEDLWQLLLEARSTWSSIPKERFNSDAFYHPDPEHGGTVSLFRLMICMIESMGVEPVADGCITSIVPRPRRTFPL
jgi:hypothetical protein